MVSDKEIRIEVAYALPTVQKIIEVTVPDVTTVSEAIKLSKICEYFPEIDLNQTKIGIFGKLVKLETLLKDRDRVEIYRHLIADPKETRRRRAERSNLKKS